MLGLPMRHAYPVTSSSLGSHAMHIDWLDRLKLGGTVIGQSAMYYMSRMKRMRRQLMRIILMMALPLVMGSDFSVLTFNLWYNGA